MPQTKVDVADPDVSQWVSLAQAMPNWLASGGSVSHALEISQEQLEAMYQLGHGFYAQGRFEDAFKVFSMLVIFEHKNDRYLMALAGAAQMTGRYRDALQHYSTATLLLIDDPRPIYFSAECLIAIENFDLAAESLRLVIEMAEDSSVHQALGSRAAVLLSSIDNKGQVPKTGFKLSTESNASL